MGFFARGCVGGTGSQTVPQRLQKHHWSSPEKNGSAIRKNALAPGAQTERRSDAGPVRTLLGGGTSPAAFLVPVVRKRPLRETTPGDHDQEGCERATLPAHGGVGQGRFSDCGQISPCPWGLAVLGFRARRRFQPGWRGPRHHARGTNSACFVRPADRPASPPHAYH